MFKKYATNLLSVFLAIVTVGSVLYLTSPNTIVLEPLTSQLSSAVNSVVFVAATEEKKSDMWQSNYEQGRLYSERAGISVHLYRSNEQTVVDKEDSAAVLSEYFGSYAIGTPGKTSVIAEHNFQGGQRLASLPEGEIIHIDTEWGSYDYKIVRKGTATRNLIKNGTASNFIMNDDGLSVFDLCRSGDFEGIVFYTCYPFKPGTTNQRYIIFAEMIH
jgi:sortase A